MGSDTVVIGGGVIGCAVAYELARRGRRVQLVADRALGRGATQASGGMLVPYAEVPGGPMLDLSVRSLSLYDAFVARVRADSPGEEAFEYSRDGSVQVALDAPSAARLEADAVWLAGRGVRAEWLDRREVRAVEPGLCDDVAGGLLVPDHGVVGAEQLTASLWDAACAHGAGFVPARVTRIRPAGSGLVVDASGGTLEADAVVLAPGAWGASIQIDDAPPLPVAPVRGQLVHLRWPADPLQRIIWGPRCYLIPWRDGRLLVGATVEHVGYEERTTVAGVHDLLDAASELVPQAWNAAFEEARVGLRPGTPDDLPIIGRSRSMPRLVYAAGHYRNGVLLAPVTAALVGDLIVDEREDDLLRHFSPDRFGAHHG